MASPLLPGTFVRICKFTECPAGMTKFMPELMGFVGIIKKQITTDGYRISFITGPIEMNEKWMLWDVKWFTVLNDADVKKLSLADIEQFYKKLYTSSINVQELKIDMHKLRERLSEMHDAIYTIEAKIREAEESR